MPIAEVGRQCLYYEDTGGDGPVVLFSHGFLMDHEMFGAQLEEFRADHRVVVWDWRGFGLTTTDGTDFTVWDQAKDLLALLDHLGIERAVLAGMSHGGYITMRAALVAPERVRAVILIDTNAQGLEPEEAEGYRHLFEQWQTVGPTDELCEMFAGIIIGDVGIAARWKNKWQARSKESIRQVARATVQVEDIRDRLPEITCPALIVHGAEDVAFPLSRGQDIVDLLPKARDLAVVPGGHAACMTHPGAVNAVLRDFLKTL
jgi:pimeloyl-ACP methyl ester carboxylesterase